MENGDINEYQGSLVDLEKQRFEAWKQLFDRTPVGPERDRLVAVGLEITLALIKAAKKT